MKYQTIKNTRIGLFMVVCIFFFSGCSVIRDWVSFDRVPPPMTLVQVDTGDAESVYRLARQFQKKGRHKMAVAEFKKILLLDPHHFKAYNALGVSYDRLRQFNLASEAYQSALSLNPDLDYVYNNLGYSNLLQNKLSQAARNFQTAIALNHKNKLYHNNLALVKVKQEKPMAIAPRHLAVQKDRQQPTVTSEKKISTVVERRTKPAHKGMKPPIKRALVKKTIDVEISNGNGIHRMAKRVGTYLTAKGFSVTRLTNANHFNHQKTIVYYYPGYYHHALQLAQKLPGIDPAGRLQQSHRLSKKIKVLIGKDMVTLTSPIQPICNFSPHFM